MTSVLDIIHKWRERIMYGDLLRITVNAKELQQVMNDAEMYRALAHTDGAPDAR
jgi:hypothetical protein